MGFRQMGLRLNGFETDRHEAESAETEGFETDRHEAEVLEAESE